MLREIGSVFDDISQAIDFIVISLGLYITIELYKIKEVINKNTWEYYFLIFLIYLLAWVFSSKINHVYQSRRFMTAIFEMKQVIKSHLLSFVITITFIQLYNPNVINNRFLFYFETITLLMTLIVHLTVRQVIQTWRRMGRNTRFALILGYGEAAYSFIDKVNQHPQLGYKIIGYLSPEANGLKIPYLGTYSDLETILRTNIIDVTVVTAPITETKVKECLDLLDVMGKVVTILLDDSIAKISKSRSVNFGGLPMVIYDSHPRLPWQEFIKRYFDLISSGIGLILLSPLFVLIALIIKLTSKGPVFFVQERVGMNGRLFKMLKFRSMVVNAEELKQSLNHLNEMSGPVFKITKDPRVTPIGRFLRKTSLDELPQLFNVITGSMSLVGPRPPLPCEVNLYDMQYHKRLSVKPGITCTWQVSGRNNIDFEEWMLMDAEYVQQWSFWLDIKILARTIPAVLLKKGSS